MRPSCVLPAALLLSLACGDKHPVVTCLGYVSAEIRPQDTTLSIGQRFSSTVSVLECATKMAVETPITWRSRDSTIVRVDSTAGIVTAVRSGQTTVDVFALDRYNLRDPKYHAGEFRVTVR